MSETIPTKYEVWNWLQENGTADSYEEIAVALDADEGAVKSCISELNDRGYISIGVDWSITANDLDELAPSPSPFGAGSGASETDAVEPEPDDTKPHAYQDK
jgi:hypothetical protein